MTIWTSAFTSVPWCFPRMLSITSARLPGKCWPLGAPMAGPCSSSNRVVKRAELRPCLLEEYLKYCSAGVIVSASWPDTPLSYHLQENILQSLLLLLLQIGVSQRVVILRQQSPCCLSSRFPEKESCSWVSGSLRWIKKSFLFALPADPGRHTYCLPSHKKCKTIRREFETLVLSFISRW